MTAEGTVHGVPSDAPAADGKGPAVATVPAAGDVTYLGLLRNHPDFRRLYTAQLVSSLGDAFTYVVFLSLVIELTGSSLAASSAVAAAAVAYLVSPLAGVVADRVDRRRLMMSADLLRAGLVLSLVLVDSSTMAWAAIGIFAVSSAAEAFYLPASSSALPNLVPRELLARANVLLWSAWATTQGVGALLGGVIAAGGGRRAAFVVDALSFVASAMLIGRVRGRMSPDRRDRRPASPLRDLSDGLSRARSERPLGALLVLKAGFGLGFGLTALLPVFGSRVFSDGAFGVGVLYAARGVGAVVGPFLGDRFVRSDGRRLMPSVGASAALFAAGYMAFSQAPVLLLGAAAVFAAHSGGSTLWAMSGYGLQRLASDDVRGRVTSLDLTVFTVAQMLGYLVAGGAAEAFHPRTVVLVVAGAELVFAAAWVAWTRRWRRPIT